MESEPKTAKGRRQIALDAATVQALRRHRRVQLEEQLAAGAGWEDGSHVFTNELGQPIHPDRFTKLFDRLVARTELPRITPHGLRHAYATLALHDSWNPKIVSERLGHANVGITLDIYSHVTPGIQQQMAEGVAAIIDTPG
jgi:integrase